MARTQNRAHYHRSRHPIAMHHARFTAAVAAVLSILAGCSTQQLYGAGQAWQKTECTKIIDAQERSRCLASTNTSFDEYQRQRDAARAVK